MAKNKNTSIIGQMMRFSGDEKGTYTASMVFAVLDALCQILPYIAIGNIVRNLFSGGRNWEFYFWALIIIAVLWIIRAVFKSISSSLSHKASFAVIANMRKELCEKLVRMPLGDVTDIPSGTMKSIIVERTESIEKILADVIPQFAGCILGFAVMLIYLFTIDWKMALITLIPVGVGLVGFIGAMRNYDVNYKNVLDKTKVLNDTAVEYINGIEVIKAFSKSKGSYKKFSEAVKNFASANIEWMRKLCVYQGFAFTIMPYTMITVIPIGGIFVSVGSLDPADFIVIIAITLGLIQPLLTLGNAMDGLEKVKVIMKEVTDILERPEIQRPETIKKEPENNKIELKDVTFAYYEKEVLHGINMEIPAGGVTAFVGPSGSGKSTIAKLIASLWDVKSGKILVGGVDIRDIPAEKYTDMVAFISQDNYLFDVSIKENIRMGKSSASDEEIIETAKSVGCHDFIMSLENGYDTSAGGSGGHLSGGERQRIAIARAMQKNAPIVIMDEATAYTDPENEALIQRSLAKLVKGKTVIVIAHRLSTITDADKIYVVCNGNIDSSGTHESLLKMNGLYKKMWDAHSSVKEETENEGVSAL